MFMNACVIYANVLKMKFILCLTVELSDGRAHYFTKMTRAYIEFEFLSNIKKYDFALSNQNNQVIAGNLFTGVLPEGSR